MTAGRTTTLFVLSVLTVVVLWALSPRVAAAQSMETFDLTGTLSGTCAGSTIPEVGQQGRVSFPRADGVTVIVTINPNADGQTNEVDVRFNTPLGLLVSSNGTDLSAITLEGMAYGRRATAGRNSGTFGASAFTPGPAGDQGSGVSIEGTFQSDSPTNVRSATARAIISNFDLTVDGTTLLGCIARATLRALNQ
jgi:hypothetical protein